MKSLRMYLLLLLLLGGIGAYADDVEFDVTGITSGKNYPSEFPGINNVTLKGRAFTAGVWTGFCLPFDASKDVLDVAFGEGLYNIQAFKSVEGNNINFEKVTEVKAATPYYIKVKNTVENPTFQNVTFASVVDDQWKVIQISDKYVFRGFYFLKYDYLLYDSSNQSNVNFFWLNADGSLADFRANEVTWAEKGRIGVNAYIFTNTYASTADKPNLNFEGQSGGESGGGEGSEDQSSQSYKIKNKLQLTDVPTVYIDVEGVGETDADLNKALYKDGATGEAPYLNAVITVKDNGTDKDTKHLEEFTDKVKIKVRGNSTANPTNGKKAYRLKFDKKLGATKHDMLGLGYSARNWTLLANVFDHSMIRNALSYHLEKEVGMDFCPGYKFADVVINGNYRGTYQICDHVEIDKNRVNIDEDTGWMLEFQGRGDMLDKPLCFSKDGILMNIKNPEPADEKDETQVADVIAPIQDWFTGTWKSKWTGSNVFDTQTGWRSVNDEESLIKFWIITELTGDYDGWMTVKAYKGADEDKLHYGPVWDKDLAYGNYSGENSNVFISDTQNSSSLTGYLKDYLFKDPRFMAKAKVRLKKLLDGGLVDRLCAKVDELGAIVAQTEELSNTKFPRSTQVDQEITNYPTYAETLEQLKTYLKTRFKTVEDLTVEAEQSATAKIDQVTYKPENAWWYTELGTEQMGKITDVLVKERTFKAGTWNTFCMPFDLSIEQMKTVFGNDVEIVKHVGMDTDAKTMLFAPIGGGTLYAATPYLVKFTGADVVNPTFKDVIITQTALQQKYNGNAVTYDGKHYFYGTLFMGYNLGVVNGESDYLFKDDAYESDASMTTFALKYGGNGSSYEKGARAFLRVPDGETPSIKILTAEEAKKFTYDVTNSYIHTVWCQYDNQTKNVTIENRGTLHAGEWNMMCLPFKLSAAGYKKAFGEDVKVAEFTGVTKSEGGELVSFNLAYINEKKGMKAATPYLIKPFKDIPMADVTFEGVKVSTKTTEEQATGDVNCKLIGTLQPTLLDKGHRQLVLKASNELQYMFPNSTIPMQACRAYFELTDTGTGTVAAAKNFSFSIDGETTGVKVIDVNAPSTSINTRVYNMNGQLVGTSMENLPQGIYVIAGKKVVK